MKKITAVIGSPRGENSTTAKLLTNFLDMVKEYNRNVEYEIIMLDGKSVGACKGCMACTRVGECIVKDGLQDIQEKLKASDMIILGSPVYVHDVSAQFKAFADRIFVWLHTLRLFGKPSMNVITTAGSGISPTRKFLKLVSYLLGTIPVGNIEVMEYFNRNYTTMDFCRSRYSKLAQKAARILDGSIKLKPGIMNEFYFWAMKSKSRYAHWLPYENQYWTSKGWNKMSYRKVFKALNT